MNFNAKCPSNLKAVHWAIRNVGKFKPEVFAFIFPPFPRHK